MRRMTAMIAGLVLLGGCGPSAPEPVRKEIRVRGEAQNQLAAASEMDRSIGLKRAIYDTGSVCKRLIGSKFVTEYKNLSMWQARCDDGKEWAIFVAPEGSTQVRPCADLKELKLPECGAIENSAPDKKTAGTKPAA